MAGEVRRWHVLHLIGRLGTTGREVRAAERGERTGARGRRTWAQYLIVTADPSELEGFDSDYNNLGTFIREAAPSRPPAEEDFRPAADDFFRTTQSKAVAALNGERYYSLGDWRAATGWEAHSIFAHPRYTDPEHRDFTLRPDSPNIGAGEGGATIGALGVGGG